MAERVVSPGVFTNEIDQSFLPAAVSNIGAALIGVCEKGPAFIPTVVNTFTDFKLTFGGLNPDFFLPYTAKSYLKNSGTATIVRVLGSNGYTATNAVILKDQGAGGSFASASFGLDGGATGSAFIGEELILTGSDGASYTFEPWSGSSFNAEGPGAFGHTEPGSGTQWFWSLDSINISSSAMNLIGAINSASIGFSAATSSVAGEAPAGNPIIDIELTGSVSSSVLNTFIIDRSVATTLYVVGNEDAAVFGGGVNTTNANVYAG